MERFRMDKAVRLKTVLFLMLISVMLNGCFSKYKLNFDENSIALVSCDERVIKKVNITDGDSYDLLYSLSLEKGERGSKKVYLEKYNEGYRTGLNNIFRLQPNKSYIITSVMGDSSLEMTIYTNDESKIKSVRNSFSCSD